MQRKPVLNKVVCETKVTKTRPCKVTTFLSSNSKWKAFSEQSQPLAAIHNDVLHFLLFKVSTKGCSKLTQAYNKVHDIVYSTVVHVNGSLCAKSVSHCSPWSCSRSPQKLFCTKSSVHGILVIKTRLSLTTKRVKSSFHWTVKTAFNNLCGQRPPAFYDQNSSTHGSLCTKKSLWWATTCWTRPVTIRFLMHRTI